MPSKQPSRNKSVSSDQITATLIEDCPLTRAETFIMENIQKPVLPGDIAVAAGTNMRALQRLFRKKYAATPTQVLMTKRIVAARDMILSGEAQSVRQVAAQLQFSNPSRFSKLYRRMHANTPSDEIRQIKAGVNGLSPANQ